jgi:hypothetical protein
MTKENVNICSTISIISSVLTYIAGTHLRSFSGPETTADVSVFTLCLPWIKRGGASVLLFRGLHLLGLIANQRYKFC